MNNFQNDRPHILFVCGRNQWRSPTAENIYKNDDRIFVRSAGIRGNKGHQITEKDLNWADLVLVMERNYQAWILGKFRHMELPQIKNLDIPDDYKYMDKELIELIELSVEYHIKHLLNHPAN